MFPKWFQSSCTSFLFIGAIGGVLAINGGREGPGAPSAFAAPQPKSSSSKSSGKTRSTSLPKILKEVELQYAKAGTLSADFTQVSHNANLGQDKTSTGKILVKRPSKIRWETQSPEENLLVGDGKKFWFYTPPFEPGESGQLVEKPASQVQTRLANALLSGSFSLSQFKAIQQIKPEVFQFTPQPGTAGTVRQAIVEIHPQQKRIEAVTLLHEGGNQAKITLSNIKLGEPLKEDLFHFVPPPKTDRIDPK